jgi:flagellar basal body-associated protein FliL
MLLTLFASKSFADIRNPQGKSVLREEIVNRLNTVLDEDAVKAVYFTEFIVQ